MDDASADTAPFSCVVALPLGRVAVTVDRRGLALSARGGFEAHWAEDRPGSDLAPEAFRLRVREHLRRVARHEEGREPAGIVLNLAAHQLLDDVQGWCRLNR